VEGDTGHDEVAMELWVESVAICRDVGDNLLLAHKVQHLGDLHRRLGRLDEAAAFYEEALTLYRNHEDPPALDFANAVRPMAILKEDTQATEEAIQLWREAHDLYEAANVQEGVEESARCIRRLTGDLR
jgi:tetratricopeptide (TPR) repeat protein